MKKNIYYLKIIGVCISIFSSIILFNSCSKKLDLPEYNAYSPTSLDPTGGNWKTYVLASANDINVPTPSDPSSANYLKEIQSLKTIQSQLTDDQKNAVAYWSVGGVFRWNEIAREIAAKYNLTPQQNPDGTYPVPDANNPFNYPKFPFANPPYAARAFAYLAVAQYDALVATWNYKFKYNRLAPYKNDNSIHALVPLTELPSYPSEDAVIARASVNILKKMFPCEAVYLEQKAAEHLNSRLWASANVQSDLAIGDTLGRLIAAKVLARAKSDGMGSANNQLKVDSLKTSASARWQTSLWESLESPKRPPMLPVYGNVKNWNFTASQKIALRPPAPPTLESDQFKNALEELRGYSKNLSSDQYRIASYWSDGVGSYTPPGHWNREAANLCYKNKFSELRTARTMALLGTAVMDAGVCCWETKYFYFVPRPSQVDPSIKTTIGVPNFPSYTSGHSTFSGAGASVLSYIFPDQTDALNAKAAEASISRIYGCIHYRFDCDAGLKCGKNIGQFSVLRGQNDGSGL